MSLQKNMSKISKTEISTILMKLNEKIAQPELCDFKTVRKKANWSGTESEQAKKSNGRVWIVCHRKQ